MPRPDSATASASRPRRLFAAAWFGFAALLLIPGAPPAAATLATGDDHSCALTPSGGVRCWGYGGRAQTGTWGDRYTPFDVPGISGATAVASGGAHSCALLGSGAIKCWGAGDRGQLGDGSTSYASVSPVDVQGISNATAISTGFEHSCALLSGGTVSCWGANDNGQIGNGNIVDQLIPVAATGLTGVAGIAAGKRHSCARLSAGGVRCWGDNEQGQLGDASNTDRPIAVTVSGLADAAGIAAGGEHSCAPRSGGGVVCWGDNYYGQLGDGGTADSTVPVAVGAGLAGVVEVSVNGFSSCARLGSGGLRCWGSNSHGQLGNGSKSDTAVTSPVAVSGISDAQSLAMGSVHACALGGGNLIRCWGRNSYGQVGNGFGQTFLVPVNLTNVAAPTLLANGENHACALASGVVSCWGKNIHGQLGDGSTDDSFTAVATGITTATALVAGQNHACALLADSSVRCWGLNGDGQLGDNSNTSRPSPVAVSGLSGVTALAAGFRHTCALLADQTLRCWGGNWNGQLGNGSSGTFEMTPVTVSGLTGVAQIAAGDQHTCAGLGSGAVRCWGANVQGQLGDGTTDMRTTPVAVGGITAATTSGTLALGDLHSCARTAAGNVACWGWDGYSQLGQGSAVGNSTVPLQVTGLGGAVWIAAGDRHTCALLGDGSAACWGDGNTGQLGDGGQGTAWTPRTVQALSDATRLSAGFDVSCALVASGTPKCWGLNNNGQLGTGHGSYETTPQAVLGSPFQNTYTIGGTLTGLATGNSVELQNNGGDTLILGADGGFSFATPLNDGSSYAVTVSNQPTGPNQTCIVANAGGTLVGADVSDVTVTCTTNTYTVGGTLSGLGAGKSVVLQNNAGDNLTLAGNGSFTFASALADGSAYNVSVLTQPGGQGCTVGAGSGSLGGANVTSVTVNCVTGAVTYTVTPSAGAGGSISPNTPQTVAKDGTLTFTVSPDPGYAVSVGGSCPGSLSGATYSAGPISADCSVVASFTPGTSTVAAFTTPTRLNQAASFAVQVTGIGSAPADGQVTVSAGTGESCSTSARTTLGNVASFSCQITFTSPGPRSMTATFAGSSSHAGSTSASAPLSAMRFADLSITVDDGAGTSTAGAPIEYLIEIRNAGPDAAPATDLVSIPTPALLGPSWNCLVPAGSAATCPAASGSGLNTPEMHLPANSRLDFLLRGSLAGSLPATVQLEVEARSQDNAPDYVHDPNLLDNYATDSNSNATIFNNGFETQP